MSTQHPMSLIHTGIGPRLMVSRAPSHLTRDSLVGSSQKIQLLSLYRHLFRLRHFIGDSTAQQDGFCTLLRRKIRHSDLQTRRNKFLGLSDAISPEAMAQRLANTYAFVFNASCAAQIPGKDVFFYEDLKQAAQERIETGVVATMVQMDSECPPEIKYDHQLKWVDKVREFYHVIHTEQRQQEINRLHRLQKGHFVGYLQYEQTLMRANETSQMCL